MRAGYGLRLFAGFAGLVLVMLIVSGLVFLSLFGGYREELDRSELRTAGNALVVEILRILRRVDAFERGELITLIREQAEHAGLIVVLTDGRGQVIPGFEPGPALKGNEIGFGYSEIAEKADAAGWLHTKFYVGGEWRQVLARTLVVPPGAAAGSRSADPRGVILMAVAFDEEHRLASADRLVGRWLMAGLAGLGVAVLLALILSRQLMRPLEALTGVVRRFGPERYDMRAAETGPTQVRELAAAFNAMAERVADNERAMRGFIADVSHELRTPLTSIRGFVEALRDGTITAPARRESSLDVIHQESARMLRMIEQLLDLSRLEAGQYRLERSAIDLAELFAQVEAMFAPRAHEQGVELRVEIGDGADQIEADYDRLVQVLNNLLENALRHTAQGNVTISTRRSSGSSDGSLEIRVADSGDGIAADDLAHLFDRFWQPESRTGPGAGLGLAISREIVRAHGGQISAASELGVGTTIMVRLPLASS